MTCHRTECMEIEKALKEKLTQVEAERKKMIAVMEQMAAALTANMHMMDEFSFRQTMEGRKGFDTLRALAAYKELME